MEIKRNLLTAYIVTVKMLQLVILFLGFLGLIKYFTAPNPIVKEIGMGEASSITGGGGFIIK